MSIKNIYERLNLTSNLEREEARFIARIREILGRAHDLLPYNTKGTIISDMAFELGEESPMILSSFLNGVNFPEALVIAETFLQTVDNQVGLDKSHYRYYSRNIERAINLSIIDLGYDFKDGKIYKKGAAELDEKLILEPLEWLSDFPEAKKLFEDSLREYLKKDYPDVIAKSRSALESLVKTFLDNNKNLKANTPILIKRLNLPQQWGKILHNYCEYANEFSSRHGKKESGKKIKIELSLVEAYIYFTGLVMRLIIRSVK